MVFNRNSREGHLLAEGARICELPHESGDSPPVVIYFACDGYGRKLAEWLKSQRNHEALVQIIDELERLCAFIVVDHNAVLFVSEQVPLFDDANLAYDQLNAAKAPYVEANIVVAQLKLKADSHTSQFTI